MPLKNLLVVTKYITNFQSAKLLVRLLKGQTHLVNKIELDDRLNASFLGEVILQNPDQHEIDENILEKIKLVLLLIAWTLIYLIVFKYNNRCLKCFTLLTHKHSFVHLIMRTTPHRYK